MEVSINANMCDQSTYKIADALHKPFKTIGRALTGDYGGTMKQLWIDFELIQSHAELRPPRPFRFQKRVSGHSKLTGLTMPDQENIGHYSVRPEFVTLRTVSLDSVVSYALNLIYSSTSVLIAKQKKLGGFDAPKFRLAFLASCKQHGYEISPTDDGI